MSTQTAFSHNAARRRWPAPLALFIFAAAGLAGYLLGKPAPVRSTGSSVNVSVVANETTVRIPESGGARAIRSAKAGSTWDDRWHTAFGRSPTPARTRELAALIEELARTDHERALALAATNENWRLRDILRSAALRGWASVAPDAAGDFALSLRLEDRRAAVAAVLQGTGSPAETVRLALRLCEADPGPAGDYGHATIAALVDVGAFAEAVKFGEAIGTEKHPYLWKSAFFQWSRNQPDEALAACGAIEDPVLRARARGEVTAGWAWADPSGLAEHAAKLPAGEDRKSALAEALPLWMERDPDTAIDWINAHDSGPEFDAGISAAANLQDFVVHRPATAMSLAAGISDAALRKQTMLGVFRQWVLADLAAARAYATGRESAADRTMLQTELEDLP